MPKRFGTGMRRVTGPLRTLLVGPQILAFVPALTLAGYWYGGEALLFISALFLPAALGLLAAFGGTGRRSAGRETRDPATGLVLAGSAVAALDVGLSDASESLQRTACLAIAIDDFDTLEKRLGGEDRDRLLKTCASRLLESLRGGDVLARDGSGGFCVALAPVRNLDLETLIQLASRLQGALQPAIALGGQQLHLTVSVGFCLPRRAQERSGAGCRSAARAALADAGRSGPGSIRAFSPARSGAAAATTDDLSDGKEEIRVALANGDIVAWFQPQLCTDTGAVSGMEALARWIHPTLGVIAPGDFLPVIAAAGLQRALTDTMLGEAMAAMAKWHDCGLPVPQVAVNFASEDLADPMLVERVRWQLDQAGLPPDRLVVEVLETVISDTRDDAVTRTIEALAALGCQIDLDDFGTGHAAIANIRRYRVGRIKIDRSLVTRLDQDANQRTMVSAILELAHRLGVETLAEGVETVGEHALLAQLGCGHVQGFSIARPMTLEATLAWLHSRKAAAARPFWPSQRAG